MNGQQKIFRVRRNYNRWVANQTLEDYALRFTAKKSRKWSEWQVSLTALGGISFLALEAIGGTLTLTYGFVNAVSAVLTVGAIIFLTGLPISYHAAKLGTDIDLLTRGAGFGYIGSTVTSLIYASFTFIFFALEATILSMALELTLNIPLSIGYLISSLVVIPLVTHGITLISRFQVWTHPLWIALQIIPLVCIALKSDDAMALWTGYKPISATEDFDLAAFGAASVVAFSLIAQVGEQVDFLRFLPEKSNQNKLTWWAALISGGPGWIFPGMAKILIGSFLAVLAIEHGIGFEQASDPNHMYLTAFGYLTTSPELPLLLTGIFVIFSQLKINVTNAYAGSIAWSNFFSRTTQNHPGRVVWLVFNVVIALMLMELGIYHALKEILGLFAIIAIAWVGSLVADLTINLPLGLRPRKMEFKRAHLYDINPVGIGSMLTASLIGLIAYSGLFGINFQAMSPYLTLALTFFCTPLIAWLTNGRYYIARDPENAGKNPNQVCCICEHHFESEDMSLCPAYAGAICSLCCSLDSRCHDMCKTNAGMADQISLALNKIMPDAWSGIITARLGNFFGLFVLTGILMSSLLALIYFQITSDETIDKALITDALINIFFILLIISGVVSWMFSLLHESRKLALEESRNQTDLLIAEIEAHQMTDLKLQQAKEVAEAANQAKSRYLTGISHELRSPLNAILGYAQLLEKDKAIPGNRRDALSVIRRSSEHLADIIEGLLDISRIEAGRLQISKNDVDFIAMLDQIVNMFKVQSTAKGIQFVHEQLTPLPKTIRTDEKRLRQILINLISNAVKYTHQGEVYFSVSYRNQVAVFSIKDTGEGIEPENIEKIFQPFERIRKAGAPYISGTGLDLTITRFLTDIMGGEIIVNSSPNQGSLFKVSLMLSSVNAIKAPHDQPAAIPSGYQGIEQTIFIVDDDPSHRGLLIDMLSPLGFNVFQAQDGLTCLDMLQYCKKKPQIFLLDIAMPGMSGWELAGRIRSQIPSATVIMVSANAHQPNSIFAEHLPYDAYLVKPIKLANMMDLIEKYLPIRWVYSTGDSFSDEGKIPPPLANESSPSRKIESNSEITLLPYRMLDRSDRETIIQLAKIGYINELLSFLKGLEGDRKLKKQHADRLTNLAKNYRFDELVTCLEEML